MSKLSTTKRVALLYAALCTFRISNVLMIQTQFDPDEYWQTLEPAYCEAFPEKPCAYTWEWTRRSATTGGPWWKRSMEGPIRSYLNILPTYVFYVVAKWWQWDSIPWVIPKGPMLVHAVLVAAPTDLATWFIARSMSNKRGMGLLPVFCILCSVASWFNGYALIRTYSNSFETMLLSVGIALVSPELFGNTPGPSPALRTAVAFVLGGMSVAVRFTSLAAWIPIVILLACQRSTLIKRLSFLIVPCALCGLVGILLSLFVDRFFYGFWTVPFLGALHFNVVLGSGSLYGTHSSHWYLSAGIPAISGLMLPFLLYDVWKLLSGNSSISQRNAWIIIASYTVFHSCSPHKEFRFLLPLMPLFCVRAGHVLWKLGKKVWLVSLLLAIPNLVALLFLGTIHQRAPLEVNRAIQNLALTKGGSKANYTVHYLMGCHSTPLYSHLHLPSIDIQAWTLDCPPECRSSAETPCESDLFAQDPVQFVQRAYFVEQDGTCSAPNEETCVSDGVPDFVVLFAKDALVLKNHFDRMGLVEADRFLHTITGVRVGSFMAGKNDDVSFRHVTWWGVEFHFDDMIVYAKQ